MSAPCPPVAVIGAGFSGTMVALHLAATLPPDRPVLLCEREAFACGPAYATRNAGHLLNVRAANMSAFPDRPDHFEQWLATEPEIDAGEVRDTEAGKFASRGLYRRYLCALLDRAGGRVQRLPVEIVDIEREGALWRLHAADGGSRVAAAVVLAIGNLPPQDSDSRLHRTNPWAPGVAEGLSPDLPVLVLGTGLTMVDLVLQLRDSGFPGPVVAVSRRGLLPQRHAVARPWPTPDLSDAERGSLALLLGRMRWEAQRAAARGVDWRGVVDSLRPITADIWRSLGPADRGRFLRHLRPYWDVHRHRLAPVVADRLDALRAEGFLRVLRGRVTGMQLGTDRVETIIRTGRGTQVMPLTVQRVINATGLPTVREADSRLVQALRRRTLARLDAFAMGLDVAETLALRDPNGRAIPGLWALGPIVRGVFWECVAVPDVRVQAHAVARRVGAALGAAAVAA
jgi:uncharacterized NAD(P)/FAD-binding protein YdhS